MSIVLNDQVPGFEIHGSILKGLATPDRGARQLEVWHSVLAPGSATPPHVHDDEEVVVVLSGRGEIVIGHERIPFQAPCTLIAPARVPHQIFNTGRVPAQSLAVLPLRSRITVVGGETPPMPWRR